MRSVVGVVGMGGAGFPTKVKLSPKAEKIEAILWQTVRSVNHISLPITDV